MEKESQTIFEKNVIEFVTVAAEFCAFLERAEHMKRKAFVDTSLKILPLLYLKASLLPKCETIGDEAPETYVTEETYEILRINLAGLMGEKDDYLDVFVQDMVYSDQPIKKSISEDLADIYQDIKDFIFVFQLGLNETMNDSLAICQENFGLLWGQKLVNTLRALHDVKYNQQDENDEEDNEEENNELSDDDYCCEEDGCHCHDHNHEDGCHRHDDECHCHDDGYHCRDDEETKMIVRRSINKDELKELPKTVFPGRIHVIQSEAETEKAVAYLKSQPILGIDSETRPSFTKGQSHKVALLQISSDECCFLFRLNMTGLTQPLVDLLENPAVIKVGLSLKDDFMMLHKRAPFTQQSCIELQDYVRQFGIQDKSLQKIYAILFKEKISKSQRLSNWEADVLSDGQKQYAATDAWACLNIYNLLQELKRTGNYEVESLPAEEEVNASSLANR